MKKKKINNFTELYEATVSGDSLISGFIQGHLVVEFLLLKIVEISQPKLIDLAEGLNHLRLIQLAYGLGHITEGQRDTLISINQMRNKFAHHLTYEPPIEDVKLIFINTSKSFHDLTDGIRQGLDELKGKNYINECEEWMIPELFVQISYDLHSIYNELGGDIEDF